MTSVQTHEARSTNQPDSRFRHAVVALALIGAASLVPLIVASFFNHPSADDFSYSVATHAAAQADGIASVIQAAFDTSMRYMQTWQGLYSSAFVLALNPAIFGEDFYALACPLLMTVSLGAFLLFFRPLCRNVIASPSKAWVGVALLAWLFFIQTMPSPVQGLYWYNGAMNYLFFWSLGLIVLAMMVSYLASSGWKAAILLLVSTLLAFIVAGGNHVSSFACILGLTYIAAVDAIRHRRFFALIPLAACIIGFAIVMTAPGTAVRSARLAAEAGVHNSIPWTLAMAPYTLLSCLSEWVNLQYLCFLALAAPLFHRICSAGGMKTGLLTVRNATLIALASCAFLVGMLCVPLYSLQSLGEPRIADILYASFVVLGAFTAFVFYGALFQQGIPERLASALSFRSRASVVAAAVLLLAIVVAPSTFSTAFDELRSGRIQSYDAQIDARLAVYEDDSIRDAVFPQLTEKPELIYFDDITEDPADWRNVDAAAYYNKDTVALEPPADDANRTS